MTAKEFWNDFENYEQNLRFYLDSLPNVKDHSAYNYICAQLDTYCPGLEAILTSRSKEKDDGHTLVISCNGDKDLFLYINRLVDEAPKILEWDIKAFIQPKFMEGSEIWDNPYTFDSFSITPKDIFFTVIAWDHEKNLFDILFLLPLILTDVDNDKLKQAFFFILQELWGERFVADRIHSLSFIDHINSKFDFLEFELLQECLESFKE